MAPKSLTDTARDILQKKPAAAAQVDEAVLIDEGAYPDLAGKDKGADRGAKTKTANSATLRPDSKHKDGPKKLSAGGPVEKEEDLGAAIIRADDPATGVFKAGKGVSKDKSKASKAPVGSEPAKKLSEEEEGEEIEMSEELEAFIEKMVAEGASDEDIEAAIAENFEVVEEEVIDEMTCSDDDKKDDDKKDDDKKSDKKENPFAKKSEKSDDDSDDKGDDDKKGKNPFAEEYSVDMSEHVDALFAGEELSEEFRTKATTIFEAAVKQKVEEEILKIQEAYAETIEEEVEKIQQELAESVDDYLNYVVEQWMEENKVAIESGLRTEITENFMQALRGLFLEYNIDMPEDKVDVVEQLQNQVSEVEAKLNEEIERNVEYSKQLAEAKKFEILVSETSGLTDTQAEKLKSLAENLDFVSEEDFSTKVQTLKENYFKTSVKTDKVLDNEERADQTPGMINENLSGPMGAYVRVLGSKLPK
jgi:hypothetical protein